MIEFALTMQQYSKLTMGPMSAEAEEFGGLANCYATKLQSYLLNENLNRYADYMSMQPAPVLSQKQAALGELSEMVEWR